MILFFLLLAACGGASEAEQEAFYTDGDWHEIPAPPTSPPNTHCFQWWAGSYPGGAYCWQVESLSSRGSAASLQSCH